MPMLELLPLPKPDELLYSVFARFGRRLALPNHKDLITLLFGRNSGTSVISLPSNLAAFQSRVPPAHPLSRANLIDELTLFPLYAPFMNPTRAEQLQADMNGDGGRSASLRAGLMTHRIAHRGMQACPRCIAEDLALDGEPFWHRSHQVPGVVICNIHQTDLIDTGLAPASRVNRQEFVMPSDSVAGRVAQNSPIPAHEIQDHVLIANYAAMLLSQRGWRMTLERWAGLYQALLRERGYAAGNHYFHVSRLIADFTDRFTEAFLRRLGCESPGGRAESWLARLVRRPRVSRPALHHFLLWLFLDLPPSEILRQCRSDFRPPTVLVSHPVVSKPQERGAEWNRRLRGLWEDSTLSLRELGRQLKVDPITVKRHAVKMGLAFPRRFVRPTTTAGVDQMIRRRANRDADTMTLLNLRKEAWLGLRGRHPEKSAKQLRSLDPALYASLYRADRGWLLSHQPKFQRSQPPGHVDWAVRDAALLEKLKTAHISLTVTPERPGQITIAALGRKARARALLEKHLTRLPKCRDFLREIVEDRVQYALRRLGFAAATFRTSHKPLVAWRLFQMAGIRSDLARHPQIRRYVEELVLNSSPAQNANTGRAAVRRSGKAQHCTHRKGHGWRDRFDEGA